MGFPLRDGGRRPIQNGGESNTTTIIKESFKESYYIIFTLNHIQYIYVHAYVCICICVSICKWSYSTWADNDLLKNNSKMASKNLSLWYKKLPFDWLVRLVQVTHQQYGLLLLSLVISQRLKGCPYH